MEGAEVPLFMYFTRDYFICVNWIGIKMGHTIDLEDEPYLFLISTSSIDRSKNKYGSPY